MYCKGDRVIVNIHVDFCPTFIKECNNTSIRKITDRVHDFMLVKCEHALCYCNDKEIITKINYKKILEIL